MVFNVTRLQQRAIFKALFNPDSHVIDAVLIIMSFKKHADKTFPTVYVELKSRILHRQSGGSFFLSLYEITALRDIPSTHMYVFVCESVCFSLEIYMFNNCMIAG